MGTITLLEKIPKIYNLKLLLEEAAQRVTNTHRRYSSSFVPQSPRHPELCPSSPKQVPRGQRLVLADPATQPQGRVSLQGLLQGSQTGLGLREPRPVPVSPHFLSLGSRGA